MVKKKKRTIKKEQELRPATMYETLGIRVKDLVTGFSGIAIARVHFLNGCVQYMVKPDRLGKDDKPIPADGIDYNQLVVVDNGIIPKESKKKKEKPTGGIMPDTPIM